MALFAVQVERGGFLGGFTVDAFETMRIKSMLHRDGFAEALVALRKNCFPTYAKVTPVHGLT